MFKDIVSLWHKFQADPKENQIYLSEFINKIKALDVLVEFEEKDGVEIFPVHSIDESGDNRVMFIYIPDGDGNNVIRKAIEQGTQYKEMTAEQVFISAGVQMVSISLIEDIDSFEVFPVDMVSLISCCALSDGTLTIDEIMEIFNKGKEKNIFYRILFFSICVLILLFLVFYFSL
ncbi:MAG: hypothetical protein XXXJIFNMEKO3_02709 [Candidatus Erwinia impunctatus]|nr:hypothetical protein XXXJIFNMEKO_02709 [Culicoides impunctatus]